MEDSLGQLNQIPVKPPIRVSHLSLMIRLRSFKRLSMERNKERYL